MSVASPSPTRSINSTLRRLHIVGGKAYVEGATPDDLVEALLYVAPDGRVLARQRPPDSGIDQLADRDSLSPRAVALAGIDQV